jgi:hypothetical protein
MRSYFATIRTSVATDRKFVGHDLARGIVKRFPLGFPFADQRGYE